LLKVLGLREAKARLYAIGHPLIASEMTKVWLLAGFHVPLRLYVYEEEGKTLLTYVEPSSVLTAPEVADVARQLDEKLASLTATAAA
jgi:uncharacterized protein (DUF302 family)